MGIPKNAVACVDSQRCGVAYHFPSTVAACGATRALARASSVAQMRPRTRQSDPSCPVHGIEPEVELEMAALNAKQVAAGVLTAATVLGLCSCSSNNGTTPGPGPTASVEQPYTPTAEPIAVAEDLLPAWWAEAGDVFPAEYGIPAAYAPDYVFSDTPRGAHEQWIFDNYPQHWEAGVRAMSPYINWYPWGWDGKIDYRRGPDGLYALDEDGNRIVESWPEPGPAPLVQFYDGVRYDGTPMLPLAFGANDPMQRPSAVAGDAVRTMYRVSVITSSKAGFYIDSPSNGLGEREPFRTPVRKDGFGIPSVRAYNLDDVVEHLKSGDFIVPGKDVPESQWRRLLPGEVTIYVMDEENFPIEGAYWDPVQEKFFIPKDLCDWKPQYRTEYPDLCE